MNRSLANGDYVQAEKICLYMIEFAEQHLKNNPKYYAVPFADAAGLYNEWQKFDKSIEYSLKALKILEPNVGPNDPSLTGALTNLGNAYYSVSELPKAEQIARRVLQIRRAIPGTDSEDYAAALENLAMVVEGFGRYAESDPMYNEVLRIRMNLPERQNLRIAQTINHLGISCLEQHRLDDARMYLSQSVEIFTQELGPRHPVLIAPLRNLAMLEITTHQFDDAEKLVVQMEQIEQDVFKDAPLTVSSAVRARLLVTRGDYAGAEQIFRKILKVYRETQQGREHQASALGSLGESLFHQSKPDEAAASLDEAIQLGLAAQISEYSLMEWYLFRGQCRELQGQHAQALADIDAAIAYAERERTRFSGSESEQSESFQGITDVYRVASKLSLADGNRAKAVEYSERARARALFDQMATAHVDLLAGLPPEQAADLQADLVRAEHNLLVARRDYNAVLERVDSQTEEGKEALKEPARIVAITTQQLADARAAITNASPIYRKTLEREFQPAKLADVQQWCRETKSLVLYYLVDQTDSSVLWIDPIADDIKIQPLNVGPIDTNILKVAEGPLTADKITQILADQNKEGIIDRLKKHDQASKAENQLTALGSILIPTPVLELLKSGQLEHLAIIPQSNLACLPFDALIVDFTAAGMTYLLDVAPATLYAPSLTALMNLVHWKPPETPSQREPVLTLGDVKYDGVGEGVTEIRGAKAVTKTSSERTLRDNIRANPLPFSKDETEKVAAAFQQRKIGVGQLTQGQATEANVRRNAPGRRILHFACHGMSNTSFGNSFGALVFADGPSGATNMADDGFLTVAEIYPLDLRYCDLAILSACQTNVGPVQQGEGAWTISRAFLVAGAQRVVCSQWSVSDQATSDLMAAFAESIAQGLADDSRDCAKSLHEARRLIRSKTSNPYFWAPFVLVGPP